MAIGVAAGAARAIFLGDLVARVEPARTATFRSAGLVDPSAEQRAADVARFDERFARRPAATLVHVVPGALFLLLALLQLRSGSRSTISNVHRWIGRVAIVVGMASAVAGLGFGFIAPHAGFAETLPVTLFGAMFLLAILKGYAAIRSGDRARHREWMIRAFAIGAGISVVRLVALPLDLLLTPAGVAPTTVFVASVWAGWLLAAAAGELWLARTRVLSASEVVP